MGGGGTAECTSSSLGSTLNEKKKLLCCYNARSFCVYAYSLASSLETSSEFIISINLFLHALHALGGEKKAHCFRSLLCLSIASMRFFIMIMRT